METAEALSGTADKYLPQGHVAAPYLYVIKVARSCSSSKDICFELASTKSEADELVITPSQPVLLPLAALSSTISRVVWYQVVFIERMYIHPGTKSGPAVDETILPFLIHFRPRKLSEWYRIL